MKEETHKHDLFPFCCDEVDLKKRQILPLRHHHHRKQSTAREGKVQ